MYFVGPLILFRLLHTYFLANKAIIDCRWDSIYRRGEFACLLKSGCNPKPKKQFIKVEHLFSWKSFVSIAAQINWTCRQTGKTERTGQRGCYIAKINYAKWRCELGKGLPRKSLAKLSSLIKKAPRTKNTKKRLEMKATLRPKIR